MQVFYFILSGKSLAGADAGSRESGTGKCLAVLRHTAPHFFDKVQTLPEGCVTVR